MKLKNKKRDFFVLSMLARVFSSFLVSVLFCFSLIVSSPVLAETEDSAVERSSVLKSFVGTQRGEMIASYDEQKNQHKILFYMGVVLLIFVFLTAGFGVAMGMLGKEVFVQHMICAGVTVFLAIAHSVVAIVWFFPF